MATVVTPARGQVTAEQVRQAIERGVAYLKSQQNEAQGGWGEQPGYPGGVSSLCALALINCGVPLDDPELKKALEYVRQPKGPLRTYSVSLQTMVLCAAEPERDRLQIRENVAWLQQTQINSGSQIGSWWYGEARTSGDPSNTQFAMLALYEAERVGVDVPDAIWRKALGVLDSSAAGGWFLGVQSRATFKRKHDLRRRGLHDHCFGTTDRRRRDGNGREGAVLHSKERS